MSSLLRFSLFALIALSLVSLTGCGGGSTPVQPLTTHIYAAGFETSNAGIETATVWTDGKAAALGDGVNGSYATSIAVSGGDVYVAGVEGNGTNDVAKYWKNGAAIALTDGTQRGFANAVAVFRR